MSTVDRTRVNVVVQQTAQRVTPPPAGRQFSEAIARGGQVVVRAAIAAVSHVPGMDMAAAALRGAGIGADPGTPAAPGGSVGAPMASTASTTSGAAVSPEGGPATAGTNGAASAAGVAGGTDGDLLSRGQEMSMRMLRLQEAMGEENRRYTALSNVMHARHEMSKNAINNIR